MMKKMIWIAMTAIGLVGVAGASTIFEATTANTTLVNNEFNATNGVPTLTGATPDLVYSNPGGLNNNGGFASTDGLDVLMGSALTVSNELFFSATIDSMTTNTIKAGAVVFGMSPSATFQPADNLLFQVNNGANKSQIQNIAGVDGGATADFYIVDASMEDGFGITLTANNGGYTFDLVGVEAVTDGVTNTTATFSGTFATGEFTNYFSTGHFYLSSQVDGDPSPQVVDISSATLFVVELSEVPEPTDPPEPPMPPVVDPADIIYIATPDNSTFVFNVVGGNQTPASGTLTGTAGSLDISNTGIGFGMVGFASTNDINTMSGTPLTDADLVVFKATITGITGSIKANGVEFGMSPDGTSFRPDDNLIYSMQADNNLHKFQVNVLLDPIPTINARSSVASMEDGFDITLVANKVGYSFVINGIVDSANANATTIVQSGTFIGDEFLDHFSGGHFYLAIQKQTTATTIMSISEAYIAVQKGYPATEVPILAIDPLSTNQVVISWNSSTGSVYSVQAKSNLIMDDWGTISSNLLATPPVNSYTDTVDTVEFYQVTGE
jgi:hypothetical protein